MANAYLVERYLPGLSESQVRAAVTRVADECERLSAAGEPVRYLGSTFLPGEEACLCRFEADDPDAITRASERAGLPWARITPAATLPAPERRSVTRIG